jgi:excisionase family DNA binding protein
MNEIVVALNRMKDRMTELSSNVEFLSKSIAQQLTRQYLDTEEACSVLHISERTLYEIKREGELPFIPLRRKMLFRASDIQQYLESRLKNVH